MAKSLFLLKPDLKKRDYNKISMNQAISDEQIIEYPMNNETDLILDEMQASKFSYHIYLYKLKENIS